MAFAQTIEFRFKVPKVTTVLPPPNQSLLVNRTGSTNTSTQFGVYLEYTGSLTSGSYSGSTVDPYFQYGTLKFIHSEAGVSASVYLPFFNGDWWSVMVTRKDDPYVTYDLYTVNKTLNNYGNDSIEYSGSNSIQTLFDWKKAGQTLIPGSGSSTILGQTYVPATGSFQELRYYKIPLSASQFTDFGANSNSIESNSKLTSYEDLFFRASLGGELFTGSTSIHPAVNETPSFDSGNSNFSYTGSFNFSTNRETHFYDQMLAGIKNPVSKKIQQENITLPFSGSNEKNIPQNQTLSPFISIQQESTVSQSYTRDLDYVEIAFSPQNEINDDINNQLGYFNVGEYIGDPRLVSSSATSYPALDSLREYYFQKYSNNYNWSDYIRLIKFFDNSLFKMIKDFVPARTSLASGIVIKQNLLERNKYPVPQFNTIQDQTITSSIEVGHIEGGNALNLTTQQSWSETIPTVFGPTVVEKVDQSEFYTGIFEGSTVEITNGVLAVPSESILVNNAVENRRSSKYMEVDFTSNQTKAVNQQLILSGSATRATVPDSNYTMARIINPRYVGVKNDEIDQYVNQFALFDWIGGADPQYPGGGNIHIINLIDINGKITTLSEQNKNLFTVSQIFKKGDPVYGYQTNATSTTVSIPTMNIIEGGALYNSIVAVSGSGVGSYSLLDKNFGTIQPYNISMVINNPLVQPNPILISDAGTGGTQGWLYWFFEQLNAEYISTGGLNTYFYTKLGEVVGGGPGIIKYSDTLLPIQKGDFIRIGITGTYPLDQEFPGYQLWNYNNKLNLTSTSSINSFEPLLAASVDPFLPGSNLDSPEFRIFRRVPNETFVLVENIPEYRSRGLLIPNNFNPNFDPAEIAKNIGLI
jgi:hypothetical protein